MAIINSFVNMGKINMLNSLKLYVYSAETSDVKSQLLELSDSPLNTFPKVFIREDEPIKIVLKSHNNLIDPIMLINDIPLDPQEQIVEGNEYLYLWYNDNNNRNPFFRNHFGTCQITIAIRNAVELTTYYYSHLEVLATKINAENAERILIYLESKMDDIIRACFSTTHFKTGNKDGNTNHISFALQQVNKVISIFYSLFPAFRFRPIRKVVPNITEVEFKNASIINDKAIELLCEQPTRFIPANNLQDNTLFFLNRRWSLDKLKIEVLKNNTDVYENQVIHGFLKQILHRLSEIKQICEKMIFSLPNNPFINSLPFGYQTLDNIRSMFGKRYYSKMLDECNRLIGECYNAIKYFDKHIPTKSIILNKPQMTMGFRNHSHYQQIFTVIIEWWQNSSPTPIGDQYIMSLRTIDKLFEFYCLYQQLDAFKNLGYNIISTACVSVSYKENVSNPANIYDLVSTNGDNIRFYYDFEIKRTLSKDIPLISTSAHQKKYRPDYIIWHRSTLFENFFILDAKYTFAIRAFEHYLPELVFKYFHSLYLKSCMTNPIKSILVLYPFHSREKQDNKYKSYHSNEYSVFSETPVFPVMGTIPILSEDSENDLKILQDIIRHLLHVPYKNLV